jgi:hypothetical protein
MKTITIQIPPAYTPLTFTFRYYETYSGKYKTKTRQGFYCSLTERFFYENQYGYLGLTNVKTKNVIKWQSLE